MSFSIRTLLAVPLLAVFAIAGWKCFAGLPPRTHSSWTARVNAYENRHAPEISGFDFGGFEANDEHFAGYMIRIDNAASTGPSWLKFSEGCLYVAGDRVLPHPTYQLFVSENGDTPRLVLLDADEALKFSLLQPYSKDCEVFWRALSVNQ